MYGKIFDSIYDSTVADDWRALITFQQFIVLCDADGTVDMTPQAISRRTNIPIEHIKAGIEILEAPDPYSRTEGQDGIRIERLDSHRPWGWSIVNHQQYKMMQDADDVREKNRIRKANERARKKNSHAENVTKCDSHASHAMSRHTDTDTNTDTVKKKTATKRFVAPSLDEVIAYKSEKTLSINPAQFIDFYESKGWIVGKSKMRDWKAAARGWSQREEKSNEKNGQTYRPAKSHHAQVVGMLRDRIAAEDD